MNSPTRPPSESKSWSRWTNEDEALLAELTRRKEAVYAEGIAVLTELLSGIDFTASTPKAIAEKLCTVAESLRDALIPFDRRVK